ncbi:MAG: DNA replication and repair protein RecF [Tenericutes bacterium ADurb.Bin087]|nr:MAG: DNA replication and repair protein RecF [Tenericutes bacterium ADurb.Bin087]
MLISDLELLNYRNYPKLNVIFTSGLNVIVGDNGAGKTNVVEAIHLFAFAKSFRTNETKALIRHEAPKAIISATVHIPSRTDISIELNPRSKRVLINGKVLPKVSQLSRYVRTTTFEPEDVLFFDASPTKRRRFLDSNLSSGDEVYLTTLVRYEKILKERNALLKENENDEALDIIDKLFVELAKTIVEKRTKFIRELNKTVNEVLLKLSDERLNVRLMYESSLGSVANIEKNGLKNLKEARTKESVLESTTLGPHRDDLIATINGHAVKEHASQGQKRLIVIALALAPYFLEKDLHKKPIIILDDVLSELDKGHQERLIELLLTCTQAFITATQYDNHAHAIYEVTAERELRRII